MSAFRQWTVIGVHIAIGAWLGYQYALRAQTPPDRTRWSQDVRALRGGGKSSEEAAAG